MKIKTMATIDVERLKEDLRSEDLGACFGAGFGGVLMEEFDINNAIPEELVQLAQERGVDLRRYVVE